ncbi:MAG TPA: type II toxin-antitoxin system MqsA family antitoxin [Campylobacterales bacterium]|nr:type II toxin-antitoxin system MqsA family antitoxin [Campylobacterales bacterium]
MSKDKTKCPICSGKKQASTVTFTVDLGTNLVVIRNTPATVCSLCGEEWISDKVAENIETMVQEAKMKNRMIEVVNFSLENVA